MISRAASSGRRQDSAESFTTQRGSNIQAGSIDITARGTDITMQDAKLQARDITLDAQRNINLVAAQNTAETHGSNSGSSMGAGVTFGVGSQNGISFQLSAGTSKGQANGTEVHFDNTRVTATDRDVSAKYGWPEGGAAKIALHGLAGIVQAKISGGGVAAGATAGMLNEALLPAMVAYLESQGIRRYNPDGTPNANFNELLTAGSTMLGA
ncbi:MAG: hypothetical protein EOO23_05115, partial [Comamonadaceae bacterium]